MTTDRTHAHAASILEELDALKQALSIAKKRESQLIDQLKRYMTIEGLTELDALDGQIVAKLRDREGTPAYDVPALDPDVLVTLGRIPGLFTVKHAAVKALGNSTADLAALRRVQMPGQTTSVLVVEHAK